MTELSHAVAERKLAQLFARGPTAGEMGPLFSHLQSCPRCRGVYRARATLEAKLCGTTPTVRALDRVEAAILDRTAPQRRRRPHAVLSLVGIVGTLAVAASVTLVMRPVTTQPTGPTLAGDEWIAAKGSQQEATETVAAGVGLRVFRVTDGEPRPVLQQGLSIDDVVAFTVTNRRPELRFLALFGVQGDGDVRWYAPDYGAEASVAIAADTVDLPLDMAVHLGVNHTPGLLHIVALFSEAPLATADIETRVRELDAAALSRDGLFEGPGVREYGVWLAVRESADR